jgi:hypothetical protein
MWVMNDYHNNRDWIKEYTDNVIFYDKKDNNVGANIHDYTSFIVDNYDNLPDVILFGKTNMLERHITKEEFDKVVNNKTFTPLLTQSHHVYDPICWYEDGVYCETNDYWYLLEHPCKTYARTEELKKMLGFYERSYNKFAPGGCYIVPKSNILKHSKEFYTKLRDYCDWHGTPGEAYLIERSLYHIWS